MKHKLSFQEGNEEVAVNFLTTEVPHTDLDIKHQGDDMTITFRTDYDIEPDDQTIVLESVGALAGRFNMADFYSHFFFFSTSAKAEETKRWIVKNMPRAENVLVKKCGKDERFAYKVCFTTNGPIDTKKVQDFSDAEARSTNVSTCIRAESAV